MDNILNNICLNCGGNFVERAIRPLAGLQKYPASIERVVKAQAGVKEKT